MKRLVKFAALIIVLLVLGFSSNPTIEKTRNLTLKYGKILYEKGVDWASKSDVDLVTEGKEIIEPNE